MSPRSNIENDRYEAFIAAIDAGDVKAVEKLLQKRNDPNVKNILRRTPLFAAVQQKSFDVIALLMRHGADAAGRDAINRTAFDAAIESGYTSAELQTLRQSGVAPVIESGKPTPLHVAASEGRSDLFLPLLTLIPEIDINAIDASGDTALHIAISLHEPGDMAVRFLLRMGADPAIVDKEGRTALNLCVDEGKPGLLKRLLKDPGVIATIDVPDNEKMTPLCQAVAQDAPVMVADLLKAGASANGRDNAHNPLLIALQSGHAGVAKLLVRQGGADIALYQEGLGNRHQTLMHNICVEGNHSNYRSIVQLLADHGAWIDELDDEGGTALHGACYLLDFEKIITLLDHGADPSVLNEIGYRPLDIAVIEDHPDDDEKYAVLSLLLARGANPNGEDGVEAEHPLHVMLQNDMEQFIPLLLDHGADPDARGACGATALHIAAQYGDIRLVNAFLQAGADCLAIDHDGCNVIHYAAAGNNRGIIEGFLKMNIFDLNATDGTGRTAMHHAFENDSLSAVLALFEAGADINVKDQDGLTPVQCIFSTDGTKILGALRVADKTDMTALLDTIDWSVTIGKNGRGLLHQAVELGVSETLGSLLAIGVDPLQKDHYGLSAYHHAILRHDGRLGTLLARNMLRRDPDIIHTHIDQRGWTMLHYAARTGNTDLARLLVSAGADVDAKNASGNTALHIAAHYGNGLFAQVLIDHGAQNVIKNNNGRQAFEIAVAKGYNKTAERLDPSTPKGP